jgi:uncharacterized membrane protein
MNNHTETTNSWRQLVMMIVKEGERPFSRRSAEKNRRMRATPVRMQTFNHSGRDHVELVPSSVYVIGIYIFAFGVCVSNVVNVLNFAHVEVSAYAAVSTCALLLFAFLLTRLTLTGLARLNGLRSLVGLTMRLATSTA